MTALQWQYDNMTIMKMMKMRIRMTIMGMKGKEDDDNVRNEDDYNDEGDANDVDGDYENDGDDNVDSVAGDAVRVDLFGEQLLAESVEGDELP